VDDEFERIAYLHDDLRDEQQGARAVDRAPMSPSRTSAQMVSENDYSGCLPVGMKALAPCGHRKRWLVHPGNRCFQSL
jgi:hypothetical protein